jgi:predicted ATPase
VALTDFKISGYRSIFDVWLKLKHINVIVGPNGSGKSNMYRAVYLVASAATGRLARAIVEEGGTSSVLWAGATTGKHAYKQTPLVRLSVRVNNFEYNLAFGAAGDLLRPPFFKGDPQIRREDVILLKDGKRMQLLKRRLNFLETKDTKGKSIEYTLQVADNESVLSGLREPFKFPELWALRQEFLDWRFYHDFRTDPDSPLRRPQLCVMTPIMSHDGSDLVPALATVQHFNGQMLDAALKDAFPESNLSLSHGARGTVRLSMSFPGINKEFDVSELSDGTLQYLCLMTALLSARPASLLALNEPETSIHSSLYEPLARLIVKASEQSQIWITTHSQDLADHILELTGCAPIELEKIEGETLLKNTGLGGYRDSDDDDNEGDDDDYDDQH